MSVGAIGRSVVWFLIGVVLASAGWLAVEGLHRAEKNPNPRTLRIYNVRPDLAFEIRNALNSALSPDGSNVGVAPNGRILVTAPESYQIGVEQLIKEVASHNPPATPSIHIEAWFVTASPGSPVDSPILKEIEPALRALEQAKGPTRFELLEELSTQAQAGESRSSDVRGERASMEVSVSVLRDSQDHPIVAAQLKLHHNQGPGITAQTELQPGKFLVLGQSGFSDKGATDRQLYYIVRATL